MLCQDIIIYKDITQSEVYMNSEPLKIKKRGEDGTKLITVRIREEVLSDLDKLAAETNRSRNELINLILQHGVKNIIIEE